MVQDDFAGEVGAESPGDCEHKGQSSRSTSAADALLEFRPSSGLGLHGARVFDRDRVAARVMHVLVMTGIGPG